MEIPRSFLAALSALLAACATPATWSQFRGNRPSHGFVAVPSTVRPDSDEHRGTMIWEVPIRPVLFASPVVGPDGTVYLGNLDGLLFAVRPDDGAVRWTWDARQLVPSATITSSAAVDDSGNVYVVVTGVAGQQPQSTLVSLSPSGTLRWRHTYRPGVFTTASPKTWGGGNEVEVFLPFRFNGLSIVDAFGTEILHQTLGCFGDVEGGSSFDDIWRDLLALLTGGLSEIAFPEEFKIRGLDAPLSTLDPTVALVDTGPLVRPKEALLVVATNYCAVQGVRWSRTTGQLTRAWDFIRKSSNLSSPAAGGGQVILGTADHHVLGLDLATGQQLWDFDAGEPVTSSPALLLGVNPVFAASEHHVLKLQNDGTLTLRVELADTTAASLALSSDRVFVSGTGGLHAFGFELDDELSDDLAPHGSSSPAIGPEGNLYVVTTSWLQAYRKGR